MERFFFPEFNLAWARSLDHLFSPNLSGDLRLDTHKSQIIGGDADVDHTQIIVGDTVKLLGGYILPSPRVSAPLLSTNARS